jgi:selenocysteine lyase/cysteine desulfurase
MLKESFSRFLSAAPGRIHLAAHSHHLWPDASFDAHVEAWNDAARLADRKWEHVFSAIYPRAQEHVRRLLSLSSPLSVAFSPNTHDLVRRILSCLPTDRVPRVLTTEGEFHSFSRQTARLEEDGLLEVERVPCDPLPTLSERLAARAAQGPWDLVFMSHVLFGSGFVVDVERVASHVTDPRTYVVVDGYHGFCAVPTHLQALEKRVFYMAGGYKYAMAGEGACFLHCPDGFGPRPRDTGWFASFGTLAAAQSGVPYAAGGGRFLGATFDPTALYRFVAVMDWMQRTGVTVELLREHAHRMQEVFVAELRKHPRAPLREDQLVVPLHEPRRGQFLAFETKDASAIHAKLLAANVTTDVRGDRIRFGFGPYVDEGDVVEGVRRLVG